jgi:hypothetical protein
VKGGSVGSQKKVSASQCGTLRRAASAVPSAMVPEPEAPMSVFWAKAVFVMGAVHRAGKG